MATFKVGQRVRLISATSGSPARQFVGREATIVAIPSRGGDLDCSIEIDGVDARSHGSPYPSFTCRFIRLAPLTDPKADEFIESLKRLGREPAPREEEAFAKVRKLLEQSE